ncbi:MAG: zinc-ribbon domain-containing protein [Candidatus Nanohaloarchaea archaeon]|nr:zinc-ribbon domain-containing protein [Candidatus Nanohaloarchaea archaeon]
MPVQTEEEDTDQKRECPNCGARNPPLSQYCMQCGSPVL